MLNRMTESVDWSDDLVDEHGHPVGLGHDLVVPGTPLAQHVHHRLAPSGVHDQPPPALVHLVPDAVHAPVARDYLDGYGFHAHPLALLDRLPPRPPGDGEFLVGAVAVAPAEQLELPFPPHGEECGPVPPIEPHLPLIPTDVDAVG